jgi:hypothetical protein
MACARRRGDRINMNGGLSRTRLVSLRRPRAYDGPGPPMTRSLHSPHLDAVQLPGTLRFRTAIAVACGFALVAAGVHVHVARFAAVSVANADDLAFDDPQGEAPAEDADEESPNTTGKESHRECGTLAGDLGRPVLDAGRGRFLRCDRRPSWEPRARRGDLTARGPPTPA